jgi:hypothetical protein
MKTPSEKPKQNRALAQAFLAFRFQLRKNSRLRPPQLRDGEFVLETSASDAPKQRVLHQYLSGLTELGT